MYKKSIIIILIIIILIATLGILSFFIKNKTDMSFVENGVVTFKYNGTNISSSLSKTDLTIITTIINNKVLKKDNPSCHFSENVSIRFNDEQVFCIACDNCPIIYWENKDRYINLSDNENSMLRKLLNQYGFIFPCI